MSRSGSHAGRGFRYQDAVGVLLAVRSWIGELTYGLIIPEGLDDYEVRNRSGFSLIQVKSRRNHLGDFPLGEVTKFIKALWERGDATSSQPDEFILLLENPIKGVNPPEDHILDAHPELYSDLHQSSLWNTFASRTKVCIVQTPADKAIEVISRHMRCSPLAAQVYYSELLSTLGKLANENGLIKDGHFLGLAISDIESIIRSIEPALDLTGMEKALLEGYCLPIDFLTPLNNPAFYQGVDTRPGHITAGLVLERPELRSQVVSGLDSQGASLIIGPSGAGKSALMWETVYSTRHTIRWFEIKKGEADDVTLFIRLTQALRASVLAPIGFVIDDVGHKLVSLWNELIRQVDFGSGLLLLGSIREEDLFLLTSRARSVEVRLTVNEVFAKNLWQRFKNQKQTDWPGWQEPWIRSANLLLEYTHILTTGDRLEVILQEQVDRRLRENRDNEFDVLRVIALAGAAGATVDPLLLSKALNIDLNNLHRALKRLSDEHLIADSTTGLIRGLHQLRSTILFDLCQASFFAIRSSTITQVIYSVNKESLEVLVSYIAVKYSDELDILLEALTNRILDNCDPSIAIAAFSGLGQSHIEVTLGNWIPKAQAFGLEPTQITSAVLFAIAKIDLSSLPLPDRLLVATQSLVISSNQDPRLQLLSRLSQNVLNTYLSKMDITQLRSFLGTLVGLNMPENLKNALGRIAPQFNDISLTTIADLLGAVQIVDPQIAISWTNNGIREQLLERVPKEIPWAAKVEVSSIAEGKLLQSAIFHVASSVQTNVHDEVVKLCQCLFGLDPTASIVAVDAIAADGLPSGALEFPLATKRMPRENNVFSALPEWNRRWSQAAAYFIGAESYSYYLQHAKQLLEQLLPVLERIVDSTLRRKRPPANILARYGDIYEASLSLTPPRDGHPIHGGSNIYIAPIQNIICNCSAEIIRRFTKLPDNYTAFVAWTTDLMKQMEDIRKEPWELIGGMPIDTLNQLENIIESLRLLAAESGIQNNAPWIVWSLNARNASPNNALKLVKVLANNSLKTRTQSYINKLQISLTKANITLELYARPNSVYPLPWPALEVLMIVDLDLPTDWPMWISNFGDAVRSIVGDSRQLWIVPRVEGIIISRLTVSGVLTLFPSPYEIDDWIKSLKLTRLDDLITRSAQPTLDLMAEIDGIQEFHLGEIDRPMVEQVVRNRLVQQIDEELTEFEAFTAGRPVQPLLRNLYNDVCERRFAMARSLASLTHGHITNDCLILMNTQMTLLIEDLTSHISNS